MSDQNPNLLSDPRLTAVATDDLAYTGAGLGRLLPAGVLLVLLGGAGLVFARRRRAQ